MYKNEMKKKIIFFMPSFEGGGVEKNIIIIANNFILRNINVSIITASKKIKKRFSKKIDFISPKSNFWDSKNRSIKYIICIFFLFINFLKDKKFYVFCFQGNIICTLFCKFFGIKIIIRPNSSPSGWSKNFLKKILFSKVLKLANRTIVNSIEFKKELKNHFDLESKCIYNPLNKNEIKKLSKKKIKFNFFKKNYVNIISVGRLVYQKDHITILKSINDLKNKSKLRLLIIGEGDQKHKLTNFIKKNNLNNIIKIKDRMENPFPYISKSQIMILSSHFEGLPNVLLEGLALKKFIISSDCPTGPKEILDNGKGGFLFKIGNHLELSKIILSYEKNYNLFVKKKNFSQKRLDRFDYKKNLDQYFNLFNDL
jgi:glycosyltransferase involved in cell wall biosynthesis